LGHQTLDAIVLSHPHPDHMGGLAAVVNSFEVKELWIAAPSPGGFSASLDGSEWVEDVDGFGQIMIAPPTQTSPLADLVVSVWEKDGAVRALSTGDTLALHGVGVHVLHPPLDWPPPKANRSTRSLNNASLTLRLNWAGRSILMAGDIEHEAEAHMLSALGADGHLWADVLKVPHHGSDTSSTTEFVEAVKPSWALLPVGRRNHFRFPRASVMARYERAGTRVVRADVATHRLDLRSEGIECTQWLTGYGWKKCPVGVPEQLSVRPDSLPF